VDGLFFFFFFFFFFLEEEEEDIINPQYGKPQKPSPPGQHQPERAALVILIASSLLRLTPSQLGHDLSTGSSRPPHL
jgi:hypothetical protein